jgi:hypothetical protein
MGFLVHHFTADRVGIEVDSVLCAVRELKRACAAVPRSQRYRTRPLFIYELVKDVMALQ